MRVDLHTHTTASDGTVSPGDLVRLAWENGLAGIAITDHDTTAALEEATAEGRRLGVEVIPGIEINTDEAETVRQAIAAIRGAGGVPTLSHPGPLAADAALALVPLGLLGIEVNHPDHSLEVAMRWEKLAIREGLTATGGSDYHGAKSIHPEQQLGSVLAPPAALDGLRRAQKRALTGA